jgi:hypothetical protein
MLNHAARVVLDTLLPSNAHPVLALGLFDAGFDAFWADLERSALPAWRWGFRAAVFTAVWVSPLLIRRLPPLTRLDRPTRERALAALGDSNVYLLRQMLTLLKTMAGLCYGADPRVRQALGYPRQPDHPQREAAP